MHLYYHIKRAINKSSVCCDSNCFTKQSDQVFWA